MKKILLIVMLFLCTSCYDYKETKDLLLVSGIAIEHKDNYNITFEIINTNKENNEEIKNKSYTCNSNGNTITDAFDNANKKCLKELNYSHLDIMIISNNIKINDLLFFLNNKDITPSFYLVYSDNPSEILNNKSDIYSVNSKLIKDILLSKKDKNTFDYQMSKLLNSEDIYLYNFVLEDEIKLDNIILYKERL